jgi:hypothetical protein
MFRASLLVLLAIAACGHARQGNGDDDVTPLDDAGSADAGGQGGADGGGTIADGGGETFPDARPVVPDAAPPDAAPMSTFTEPCSNGPGFALFRFHMQGTFVILDAWDAACEYSLAPESICNAYALGNIQATPDDLAVVIDGNDRVMVRFATTGLPITTATLYVRAKAISTGSPAGWIAWSPIYGELEGPDAQAGFNYPWYAVDWSDMVSPTDDPSLTAVIIQGTSGAPLGVRAVELCVQ